MLQPFPLHKKFINEVTKSFDKILIIEESSPVIEMQIARSDKSKGLSRPVV